MKCLILLALVAIASADLLTSGTSSQFRSQDNIGNYAFGYNEDHATGGTFRRESGSHGVKVGSYGLRDADGRLRIVNYVADADGFRANIQTNEPGVEPKDPAAVLINKPGMVAPVHHAPILEAAAHHSPYVHHGASHGHAAPLYAAPSHVAPYTVPSHYGAAYAAPAHYAAPSHYPAHNIFGSYY